MEDKRLEEIKYEMYRIAINRGHTDQVEAAKTYAMLCIAEHQDTNVASTCECNVNRGIEFPSDIPSYKLTE